MQRTANALPKNTDMTYLQVRYIKDMVKKFRQYGFHKPFDGDTRAEASAYISKYQHYYRDFARIEQNKLPWWCMIVNKPPYDEELQKYMLSVKERMEAERPDWEYMDTGHHGITRYSVESMAMDYMASPGHDFD